LSDKAPTEKFQDNAGNTTNKPSVELVAFDKEGEVTIDTQNVMNDIDSLKEASLADGIDSDDAQIVHVVGFTNAEIF